MEFSPNARCLATNRIAMRQLKKNPSANNEETVCGLPSDVAIDMVHIQVR